MASRLQTAVERHQKGVLRRRAGVRILLRRYEQMVGRPFPVHHPQTFQDKVFWRMISQQLDPDPTYTDLTDKLRVRDYVRATVGDAYLTRLVWHGTDPRQVPLVGLPHPCVVKPSHLGDGQGVHRLDNANRTELMASLQACLATNYYWFKREEQYYRIEPRLLVEGLIDDGEPEGPVDYRLFCFFGLPAFVRIRHQGMGGYGFFDLDWNPLDVTMSGSRYRRLAAFPRPSRLDEMVAVASALSSPFDFVRVDLYHTHEAIRFGELTFTPSAGGLGMRPSEFDVRVGQLWGIPRSDIEATARELALLRLTRLSRPT